MSAARQVTAVSPVPGTREQGPELQGTTSHTQPKGWRRPKPPPHTLPPPSAADSTPYGFRYCPPGLDEAALGALNRRIVNHLSRTGRFALAPTVLKGRLAIPVCIVNFRTTRRDLLALLDDVQSTGRLLLEQA